MVHRVVQRAGSYLSARVAVLAVALSTSRCARGQNPPGQNQPVGPNPEVIATYKGAQPKQDFAFKIKDKGYVRPAGTLHFVIPATEFGTSGLDRNFLSYCGEPLKSIVAGRTYRFELQAPETPEAFGLPDTPDGKKEAVRRATYVRELFGQHYYQSLREDDPVSATSFQIALWELTQETEVPAQDKPPPFSLFSGTFQADYPNVAASPLAVQRAEEWLGKLTGSDNVFYESEATRTQELVRMKGLANAAGEIAQSQYGLRGGIVDGQGGNAGSGITSALGSGGPLGGFGGLAAVLASVAACLVPPRERELAAAAAQRGAAVLPPRPPVPPPRPPKCPAPSFRR